MQLCGYQAIKSQLDCTTTSRPQRVTDFWLIINNYITPILFNKLLAHAARSWWGVGVDISIQLRMYIMSQIYQRYTACRGFLAQLKRQCARAMAIMCSVRGTPCCSVPQCEVNKSCNTQVQQKCLLRPYQFEYMFLGSGRVTFCFEFQKKKKKKKGVVKCWQ